MKKIVFCLLIFMFGCAHPCDLGLRTMRPSHPGYSISFPYSVAERSGKKYDSIGSRYQIDYDKLNRYIEELLPEADCYVIPRSVILYRGSYAEASILCKNTIPVSDTGIRNARGEIVYGNCIKRK